MVIVVLFVEFVIVR